MDEVWWKDGDSFSSINLNWIKENEPRLRSQWCVFVRVCVCRGGSFTFTDRTSKSGNTDRVVRRLHVL